MSDSLQSGSVSSGNGSSQNIPQGITEGEVQVTAELASRPARQPDLTAEIQALQILDSSDDCIKVLDLEGRILFMSRGGQALLGIQDLTPFLNTSWVEFWQESERQAATEAISRARAGEVCILQGYCPTLSGEPKWWDNKVSPIRGADGQVERLLCISRDITERKRSEDERKQAEDSLSAIFSQATVGLCEVSLEGNFQRVNEKLCRIMGRSSQEMLAVSMADVTYLEDIPKSLQALKQLLETGEPVSLDKRYLRPNGTTVWVNSSLTRLDDQQGRPRAILAVTVDLSDRKQAEEKLRESEERYRAIVNQAVTGVASTDLGGKLTLVNQKYCDITGYSAAELSQLRMHDITHPEDLPRNVELYNRMLTEGTPFEIEKRYIRKDGSIVWVNNYVSAICDPDGNPQSVIAIVLDITKRKQAEQTLGESEEKYRSLFNSMDEGYFLADVIFDENDQPIDIFYLDANPSATRIVGQDFAGRRLSEIDPNYESYWYEIFGRVARTGEGERLEQYAEPDQKWYDFYVFKVGDEDSRRVSVVFQNITDRKRREANAAFLAEIAGEFSRLSTTVEIMQAVGAKIGAFMNLPYCHFISINEARDEAVFLDRWNAENLPRLPDTVCLSEHVSGEFYRLVHAGETVVSNNTQTNPLTNAQANASIGAMSFITVPFHKGGEWKYLFSVHDICPRDWREDEIELVRELANCIFPRLERARAEDALRESEEKYRTLFNSMDEGFCILQMIFDDEQKPIDYRLIEINLVFEQQTGMKNALGRTIRELVPGIEELWFDIYGKVALTGEPTRFINQSKSMGRWFDVNAFRIGEPHERKVAVLFNDISNRKEFEQERERFLGVGSDLQMKTTINGFFQWVSPTFERTLGWSQDEMTSRPWTDFIHPDDINESVLEADSLFCGNKTLAFENRYRHKDGSYRWLLWKAQAYPEEQVIYGAAVDITERKQAEAEREQLLASERHYANQLQGLTNAALAINSALCVEEVLQVITDQAASIIGAHQSVTSMTLNQNWAQAINAVYLSQKYAQWRDYTELPNGSGIYACVCHLNRPLRMTQAELEAHPGWKGFGLEADKHPPMRGWLAAPLVRRDGNNIGLIQLSDKYKGEFTPSDESILVQLAQMASVAVENARLYEAEQQARATAEASREEAQAANRVKDEFLAVLSHELRSPLNPILGWSTLLLANKLDAAKSAHALAIIQRNAKLQSELIEDLLDVSRILQGKLSRDNSF